jgi:SGNH hydrolase-like domain, acetyltransferase AlgX
VASPRHTYEGRLQGVSNGHAVGFCWAPATPDERVQVAIVVDGELVAEGTADIFRPALAPYGDGAHGFLIALPESLQAPGLRRVLALAGPEQIPITVTPSFWHEADSGNGWSDVVFEPGDPPPSGAVPAAVPEPPRSPDVRAVLADGWLFDAREFAPTAADLETIVSGLSSTAIACADVGLSYVPVLVPAKRHVLAGTPWIERRWAAELRARLRDVDDVDLLDLLPILRHAARYGVSYQRTDADWNARGAFFVARALVKEARKWVPALRPLTLERLHLRPTSDYLGTLADAPRLAAHEGRLVRSDLQVEAEAGVAIDASHLSALRMPVESHLADAGDGSTHIRVYANAELEDDARLAVVGDSAALSLVPWLAECARRTTFFWSRTPPLHQLELELPPVVFHLIREADLVGAMPGETEVACQVWQSESARP